jgi:hypothetical protein
MSSLIYVARVTPLPSALLQHLQSEGFHVQSFGPGQITTDDCVMVITPEALPAGLGPVHPAAAASAIVPAAENVPALPGLMPHLGSQPTVWNSVKEFAVQESATRSAPTALPGALRSKEAGIVPRRWPSLAAAMALMFLAGVMLTRHASTFEFRSTDNAGLTNRSGKSVSHAPNSLHGPALSSSGTLKVPAAAQRHISDDDFVARDVITRFDLRSQNGAIQQNLDLRRRAQSSLKPKRTIVVD